MLPGQNCPGAFLKEKYAISEEGMKAFNELTPWSHLTADLQLVQNQNDGDDLAVIPGVRMVIDF
jgi:hypothetical protein